VAILLDEGQLLGLNVHREEMKVIRSDQIKSEEQNCSGIGV
jgi:hypothetical protein